MAYTIFALGSGQAYAKHKTINTHFYDACQTPKLLLDGPAKYAGSYDPRKIQSNIHRAMREIRNWLETAVRDKDDLYNINLTGFSRGAVTCIMIANALQKFFHDNNNSFQRKDGSTVRFDEVAVHIYAEDPVAGFSDKRNHNVRNIPSIVKNYVSTLQVDERRRGFKPQDLSRIHVEDTKETHVTYLPLYGNHSASDKAKTAKTKDTFLINHNIKYDFLRRHGSEFENFPKMEGAEKAHLSGQDQYKADSKKMIELYESAKENRNAYREKALEFQWKDTPTHPGKQRTFNKHLSDYDADGFWANAMHRQLVKKEYPKVFNYLFEKGRFNPEDPQNTGFMTNHRNAGYKRADLYDELKDLKANNPKLLKSLIAARKVKLVVVGANHEPRPCMNIPSGVSRIERCKLLNHLEGKPTPFINEFVDKLEMLNRQTVQLTYKYQREKAEWLAFSERSQVDRAQKMRRNIKAILGASYEDSLKYQRALDCLERNYREIKESGSQSKLAGALEHVLKKHGREYQFVNNPDKNIIPFAAGWAVKGIGQGVQFVGRLISPIVSGTGEFLSSLGERIFEIGTTGPKPWKYTLGGLLGIVVGGAVALAGEIVKTIGTAVDWLGRKMKRAGEVSIKSSGAYLLKRVDHATPVKTQPTTERMHSAPLKPLLQTKAIEEPQVVIAPEQSKRTESVMLRSATDTTKTHLQSAAQELERKEQKQPEQENSIRPRM